MAGPRPKRHSYNPTSKPATPNPGRQFAIPGQSSGTRPDDVRARGKTYGKQQTGAPRSKTT